MAKKFMVMHEVEHWDFTFDAPEYDEEIIAEFNTEEEAVKKIEELGGEKIRNDDDYWYDPLADPVGQYWINEV